MTNLKVINTSTNVVVVSKALAADNFFKRLKGLLGRSEFQQDEGLVIIPCNCVHSFGMKFSIDVVFLDKQGYIISLLKDFRPNKISPVVKGAKMVLELPIGTVDRLYLKEQQILEISNP